MRIAQIVTLVSPDGAYGGPLRVAINQSHSLINLGHDVVIFAGYRGFRNVPKVIEGVPAVLSKATNIVPFSGFAGTFSGKMLLRLLGQLGKFDIVHIHMARDLITLPAAAVSRILSIPYVVQTHGMVDPSDRWSAKPLDRFLTRPLLSHASRILVLTGDEEQSVSRVIGRTNNFLRITNGVPRVERTQIPTGKKREVLFMARLHEIKRPTIFARIACVLAREFPNVLFSIVGPDEGEATAVRKIIGASGLQNVRMEGAVRPEDAIDRIGQAYLFVLPSRAEVLPMSVLEALSVGIPVIITEPNGLAKDIRLNQAGRVVDQSEIQLKSAISEILSDESLHASMSRQAQNLARDNYSSEGVALTLLDIYRSIIDSTK